MPRRSIVMATIVAIAAGSGPVLIAQTTAAAKPSAKSWKAPRTSWGDPDLQGAFTNNGEADIPLERPQRFEGRRLEDITEAELAELRQQRVEEWKERNNNLGVDPEGFEGDPSKNSRAWMIVDPPDGKLPPMTDQGRKRPRQRGPLGSRGPLSALKGPEDFDLYERCITNGLPNSMMPTLYSGMWDIVQGPGYAVIRIERLHEARIVPLDGRPHANEKVRQYMGDSRGHWDGDTLVVETTNFSDRTRYMGSTDRLRLIERFKPVSPDTLEYSVTVDDPNTWTRPWTFAFNFTRERDSRVFEFACHESNYSMRLMLGNARAAEKSAAK